MWGFLAFNQFTLEAGFGTGIGAYKRQLNTRKEEGLISESLLDLFNRLFT
jgi:hypothetical protein